MIWRTLILFALMLGAMAAAKARADDCPGNPNALDTSRVLTVAPREFPRIGTAQYSQSLPLEDKQVVPTFDVRYWGVISADETERSIDAFAREPGGA
jgi:peptidoglycan-N-acetylglucosamine deacetylase